MAAYLGFDRQPAFANNLFMAGKVGPESLQSVPEVKNQRNKKSLAHMDSGMGAGQIYDHYLDDNATCLLAVTDCSRGIFETATQASVHGCIA